jgi:electron transfer flavoprotein alpha subunit
LTKVKTSQDINFLTFRSSNFDEAHTAEGNPQVTEVPLPTGIKTEFVKEETSDSSRPDLTSARIVVSGGRGVKSK